MGALDNAVTIMNNPLWRQYMTAASAYVARQVYSEPASTSDHDVRMQLAKDVLVQRDLIASQLATLLGTDPTLIAETADPAAVDENGIINAVASYWTAIAHQRYDQPL